MKKLFLTVIIFVFAFNQSFSQEKKDYSLASVGKRVYGVYIFIASEPHYEYEYIATIDVKISWSGTKAENFESTIKKAKKRYTNFNGMIFHDDNLNKADLIRFEDLKISVGGISIGDKISFLYDGNIKYGEVVALKETYGVVNCIKPYINKKMIGKDEKIKVLNIRYNKMTVISEEEFEKKEKELSSHNN